MKAFAYINPVNEKEAVAALKSGGTALPLAGGQDLLARMKDYIQQPDRIVNVKNALETTVARTPDGGMKIGAATEHTESGWWIPASRFRPPTPAPTT